jgi:hypothetical protein
LKGWAKLIRRYATLPLLEESSGFLSFEQPGYGRQKLDPTTSVARLNGLEEFLSPLPRVALRFTLGYMLSPA